MVYPRHVDLVGVAEVHRPLGVPENGALALDSDEANAYRILSATSNVVLHIATAIADPYVAWGNPTDNFRYQWNGAGAFHIGGGVGSSGQVLTSNGASAAPTWQTPASGIGGDLDDAYDFGGAGAGRSITVDSSAVQLTGSASTVNVLELTGRITLTHTDTVVGGGTHSTVGSLATIYGYGSSAGNAGGSFGYANALTGTATFGLGAQQSSSHASCILLGRTAATGGDNQCVVGSPSYPINTMFVGGVADGVPAARTIQSPPGSTSAGSSLVVQAGAAAGVSNTAGAALTLRAGAGTGTGVPGAFSVETALAGSSGSTVNTATERYSIQPTHSRYRTGANAAEFELTATAFLASAGAGTAETLWSIDLSGEQTGFARFWIDVEGVRLEGTTPVHHAMATRRVAVEIINGAGTPVTQAALQTIGTDSFDEAVTVTTDVNGGTTFRIQVTDPSVVYNWTATIRWRLCRS